MDQITKTEQEDTKLYVLDHEAPLIQCESALNDFGHKFYEFICSDQSPYQNQFLCHLKIRREFRQEDYLRKDLRVHVLHFYVIITLPDIKKSQSSRGFDKRYCKEKLPDIIESIDNALVLVQRSKVWQELATFSNSHFPCY